MHYADIPNHINQEKTNREIRIGASAEFERKSHYIEDLNDLLDHHRHSIIAMSYTSAGFPSVETLYDIMCQYKNEVVVCGLGKHPFALNRNNEDRQEVLIIGM